MAGSGWLCAVRYAPARGLCLPAAPDLHVGARRAASGSSPRRGDLPVDEVMLDLEDSVAPDAKPAARELAVGALQAGGWDGRSRWRIDGASGADGPTRA